MMSDSRCCPLKLLEECGCRLGLHRGRGLCQHLMLLSRRGGAGDGVRNGKQGLQMLQRYRGHELLGIQREASSSSSLRLLGLEIVAVVVPAHGGAPSHKGLLHELPSGGRDGRGLELLLLLLRLRLLLRLLRGPRLFLRRRPHRAERDVRSADTGERILGGTRSSELRLLLLHHLLLLRRIEAGNRGQLRAAIVVVVVVAALR